jgi:hypothetical protein
LIQTPSDIYGPARPGEITYYGLFVHEYGCMAALGNGAAIGKCVIKSKEIQGAADASQGRSVAIADQAAKNPRR